MEQYNFSIDSGKKKRAYVEGGFENSSGGKLKKIKTILPTSIELESHNQIVNSF